MTLLSEPPSSLPPRSSLHHSSSLLSVILPSLLPHSYSTCGFPLVSSYPSQNIPCTSYFLICPPSDKALLCASRAKEMYIISMILYCQGMHHAHLQSWKKCCIQFWVPHTRSFWRGSSRCIKIRSIRNLDPLSYEKRCESWAGLVRSREHWDGISLMHISISEARVSGWCQIIFTGAQWQDEEQWL